MASTGGRFAFRLPLGTHMKSRWFKAISPAGFHRLHYLDWGAADAGRVVICVHGLTRNGRDFDMLAGSLAESWRVCCPDIVGRGLSDRLATASLYAYPQYMSDVAALIARLDVDQVDWVGTSMGGLLGMMLAALPGTPIRRLVVNDVGPFIPAAALRRIGSYVGTVARFADLAALEAHMREIYAPFGPLGDAQWRHLAAHGHVVNDDGSVSANYDPAIADALRNPEIGDLDLWPVWDAVRCPTLVLRGAESDVLPAEVAQEMTLRGPRAALITLAGVGHAPALMEAGQIAAVADFLGA